MECREHTTAQAEPKQTKFEAAKEQIVSAAVEKILAGIGQFKEPFQREALQRALASIPAEVPDSEGQPELSMDLASDEFRPFVGYLMNVGIDAKIAAISLMELFDGDVQQSLSEHEAYRGDLATALYERWTLDIAATIQNPSADQETLIAAGYICGILAART